MTQDELDRVLEQALDVEPPAGYVARVRARVAAEQAASTGRYVWRPQGALAAAVLVLVAGGLLLERDDSPVRDTTVTSRGAKTFAAPGSNPGTSGIASEPLAAAKPEAAAVPTQAAARNTTTGPLRHQPRDGTGAGATTRAPSALPPVLISPDDSAGLRLLVTFTESAPAAATTGSGERAALQISRIDVTPIEVGSLPQLTPLALGELQ